MLHPSTLFQVKAGARPQALRASGFAAQRTDSTLCGIKYELAALRFEVAAIRHAYVCRKAGYKPGQPRWPKGTPGTPKPGGRWSGGAGTGQSTSDSGQPARGGHHYVPRKIFDSEALRPETRRVFEEGRTGPLRAEKHGNSKEHVIYTEAVYDKYRRFLDENKISSETMTPDQARQFLDQVKRSNDPRIRDLNLRIFRNELRYLLRRIPRRGE